MLCIKKKDSRAQISGHFHQAQIDGYHLRDTELQQAHDKLEVRVAERTQDLHAEIAERQRAESELKRQFVHISLVSQITCAISERQNTNNLLHVVLRELEVHLGPRPGSDSFA